MCLRFLALAFACGIERMVRLGRSCRGFWDRSHNTQGLLPRWRLLLRWLTVSEVLARPRLAYRHPRSSKVLLAHPILTLGCPGGGNNSRDYIGLDRRSIYTSDISELRRSVSVLVTAVQSLPVSEVKDQDCRYIRSRIIRQRNEPEVAQSSKCDRRLRDLHIPCLLPSSLQVIAACSY